MLTGKLPFDAEDSIELARKHREDVPQAPKQVNPVISDELNAFILKAMQKKPEDRFADGNHFVKALDAIESPIIPEVEPEKSQNRPIKAEKEVKNKPAKAKVGQPLVEESTPRDRYNWRTILLSLLALILAGGLIPFWIYVLFTLNK
jgi:serine/threonine-protein kinase